MGSIVFYQVDLNWFCKFFIDIADKLMEFNEKVMVIIEILQIHKDFDKMG
jgi:hypothetical protein